jgi:hypothetical protein
MTIDGLPDLPDSTPEAQAFALGGRRPSFLEGLGASVGTGWWNSVPGVLDARGRAAREEAIDPRPLSREEWQTSGFARDGISWDAGMTQGRARAMAEVFDQNRYRERILSGRDAGALETAAQFGGMIAGSLLDPLNFLPVAGPAGRALQAAGAARSAAVLARPGVAMGAVRGSIDATGGAVVAAPFIYGTQAEFGDEITAGQVALDFAVSAVLGAAFGGVAGAFDRRLQPRPEVAARIVDLAAQDVAAGRQIQVPLDVMRAEVRDAVARAAPDDFIEALNGAPVGGSRPSSPLFNLPTRPDGGELSPDEFAAVRAERMGMTREERARQIEEAARAVAREVEADNAAPSLVQWLVRNGGLNDPGGELRGVMGEARARPGLMNNQPRVEMPDGTRRGGMRPDDAVRAAREAGFFPDYETSMRDGTVDELTPTQLWDAIDAELRGVSERRGDGRGERTPRDARAAAEDVRRAAQIEEDRAYEWYREALQAERTLASLSNAPVDDVLERAAMRELEGGAEPEEAVARAMREMEPELLAELEAMRADGRFSQADQRLLDDGDAAAADLEAEAAGLEEAGACLLRNLA